MSDSTFRPGAGAEPPREQGAIILPPPDARIIVDISDCQVSDDPTRHLVTYALGSCIGVAVHDPRIGLGALGHFMLPTGTIDPAKSRDNPMMFVDTGMTALLTALYERGADPKRLVIKVAGGAQLMDRNDRFRIGERNFAILRKFLWKNGLLIAAHDTGGETSRNLFLSVGTGRVLIKSHNRLQEL